MEKRMIDLIIDILYENCCKGKKCRECEFSNNRCYLAVIIKTITKRGIYEENNKNQ